MGITLASFQSSGKVPKLREKLNRWERGSAIGTEASFSSLLLIPSGPVAFDMSKLLRTLYTSMADTTFWSMRWLQYGGRLGSEAFFSSSMVCETKELLSKLAFSRSFVTIMSSSLRGPSVGETPPFRIDLYSDHHFLEPTSVLETK